MKKWQTAGLGLALGAVCALTGCGGTPSAHTAEIVQDGRVLRTVDLSSVTQEERITVSGKAGTNIILIAPGEIRMLSADCPDQICVKTGNCRKTVCPLSVCPTGSPSSGRNKKITKKGGRFS